MKEIPHPRIGYVGYIKGQIDLGLLLELSRNLKTFSFVLVGPIKQNSMSEEQIHIIDNLKLAPNVYFLGTKSISDLPGYVQHVNICMLPYEINSYTNYIFPLKLYEYLAAGKPVIGSPIRSLIDLKDLIILAKSFDEWLKYIKLMLHPDYDSNELVLKRKKIAEKFDWNCITSEIAELFCKGLGKEYHKKFKENILINK